MKIRLFSNLSRPKRRCFASQICCQSQSDARKVITSKRLKSANRLSYLEKNTATTEIAICRKNNASGFRCYCRLWCKKRKTKPIQINMRFCVVCMRIDPPGEQRDIAHLFDIGYISSSIDTRKYRYYGPE